MKNRMITIIALVALIITIILMVKGITIGKFKISSIKDLIQRNEEVTVKLEEVAKLTTIDYAESIDSLETTSDELEKKKRNYDELINLSSDDEKSVYEVDEYNIEYLWTRIGRYATDKDIVVGMEVVKARQLL